MNSKYFKPEEFACKCKYLDCDKKDGNLISPELVAELDELRETYDKSVVIASGLRCERHNKDCGGVDDSAHTKGFAADIACASSQERFHLLPVVWSHFDRVGIHKLFLHIDIDKTKPQDVIFVY